MSNNDQVNRELDKLHKAMLLYARASGWSLDDVFEKKGAQLGYQLHLEFKGLRPGKGSVRQQRLEALKAGKGVRVRPAVYDMIAQKYGALPLSAQVMRWRTKGGKIKGTTPGGLNLQALAVKRELNLRESGRGFLGQAAKFIGSDSVQGIRAMSRYGKALGRFGFQEKSTGPEVTLTWGGWNEMTDAAVKGISRTRGMAAVSRAITAVTEDMVPYLQRKLDLTAQQMGLKV